MRITCPNCTASFEIQTELLGKKGRSLKCASCGHSWYQTPLVETIDLAEIMGHEFAARTKAEMNSTAPAPPLGKPGAAPVAAPGMAPRSMAAPAPAPPSAAPLGVSLMRKAPAAAQAPGQRAQSWKAAGVAGAAPRPGMPAQPAQAAAAAPSWYQPEKPQKIAPPPPGAPTWYQPEPPKQMGPAAAPAGAPSWYQPEPPPPMRGGGVLASVAPPPMRGGGVLASVPDPRLAPSTAAPGGQSLRGQAGAGAVGDASVSWTQQALRPQGGAMPGAAGALGVLAAAPGQQGPAAAVLRGQSLMGQAGAGVAGGPAVSWNQSGQVPPPGVLSGPPGQSLMGQAGAGTVGNAAVSWNQNALIPPPAPGGPPGQSLMGQAGAGAVGQAAISWNQQGVAPPPGTTAAALGQSMMGQAGAAAVGEAAVSWVQQPGVATQQNAPGAPGVSQLTGAIQGPGLAAQSMLDGTVRTPGQPGQSMIMPAAQGPGGTAVSQMSGEIQAPGLGSQSMLDGTVQTPGQPGQSVLQAPGGAPGAPGVSQLGQLPTGPGAPGISQLGQPGTPGAPGQSMVTPAAGATAAATTTEAKKGEASVVALEKGKTESSVALVAGESKAKDDKAGADKGPGGDTPAPLWSGAKEDEELVDPAADRPDFSTSEEAAAAKDDAADDADAGDDTNAGGDADDTLKSKRQIDPAFMTAGLMAVAVVSVVAMLWLERAPLARMWPGFNAIYSKLGMESQRPGEGLRLTQSGMRLLRVGGIETLVVKGYISNISDKDRPVAHIRLQLVDATNQVVQETSTAPEQSKLAPGASMDFEVKLELPNMAAAKNVVVNWGK